MKNITKILSLFLALTLLLSFPVAASAAELANVPTIDESKTGSLTIYKYDLTNAEKDGVWDSSYVSTGVYDEAGVNNVLGGNASSTLGNGETGYGYAIKGVEFTYVKVADIFQYGETETTDGHVEILYAVDKTKGADFLKALGLADGKNRYEKADALDETKYFYQSDVLISALSSGLTANATTVKNAMERYAATNGTAMPLTDSYGKSKVENLPLGLYLVAETKVPEMVVSTTDPFLVSVPMTSVNGSNTNDGGTRWIYDITLYPKNLTGIPSLEKTLRESKNDTGKTDTYAHTGTASAGDTIDYQIISTLPSITSEATYLSCYTFIDTLSAGLTYTKGDVTLEIFSDTACKNGFFCFLDFLLQFLVFPDIMPHCDKVDLHLDIVMTSSVESVITHILLKITESSFCFIISLEHEFLAFFTCDIFSYFIMKFIKFLAVVYASSNSGFSTS